MVTMKWNSDRICSRKAWCFLRRCMVEMSNYLSCWADEGKVPPRPGTGNQQAFTLYIYVSLDSMDHVWRQLWSALLNDIYPQNLMLC